ncbi:NADH-quinone oxidoreductase subunit C 1 [Acetobacter oeni]|uniref:NADH-quinone oxidoreductase subunit C n=1 Tax=Acetobacter oeni TaxID=304077 RepID=A0A511XIV2_9PROT|nr:NADH-quinone oxidoreductase subunit C [Acetobacter oeni]MBB3881977.1 NADH-quinone oxidoreductase subunit C [Acetobacter oeni]GBR07796.1 NADH-quinone oxidoreductase chain C [Acetobacter oeni LMG 21952]GEN62872.1 NADH-quinone oxidoreductase subunit C 1 [Acetobacter oeni]
MVDGQVPVSVGARASTGLPSLAFVLSTSLPGIASAALEGGELVVRAELERLIPLMALLRDDPRFRCEQLMDLCGVDFPQRENRFDVVYNLLSVSHNHRIRVIVTTDELTPVPSVHTLWPCATWWERECYDLFGVLFSGQPDLRRILTDYGFEGHPLRKDFPLTGYVEVRYDPERRQIVREPVSLTQDFRDFDFVSPWEGVLTLPGDERAHELRQIMQKLK